MFPFKTNFTRFPASSLKICVLLASLRWPLIRQFRLEHNLPCKRKILVASHSLRITMTEQVAVTSKLGFIGAGMMAEAIARGLDRSGVVPAHCMSASDLNAVRCGVFKDFGVSVFESNTQVLCQAVYAYVASISSGARNIEWESCYLSGPREQRRPYPCCQTASWYFSFTPLQQSRCCFHLPLNICSPV